MNTFDGIFQISRSDIPECVRVIRESFMTVAREFGYTKEKSPLFTGYRISEEILCGQFDVEKRPMFCFRAGGRIVGYYSLAKPVDGICEINNLAVLPEYRHLGIGGKLLDDALVKIAETGARKAFVDIVDENQKLRRWYESKGFRYVDTVRIEGYEFLNGIMIKDI